jgi:solute carrier family 50 protein (sugar transporter)
MSEEEDLTKDIFGWTGTVISFFFYIAPVVPYLKLIKGEKTLQESPGVLLICSLLNCILWSDYGLIGDKFQVYFANGIGACITLIFVSIYLIYLAKKNLLLSCVYITFLILCVIELYFICYYVISDEVTGIIANIFNVLMYAAPGEKMYTVCKTGNYQLIPIWSTIGALACSTSWMLYGFYLGDIMIIIPNVLGMISAVVQVAVFLVFKGKDKKKEINPNEEHVES